MHLTRAQIVGLASLAMNLPTESKFNIGEPDTHGVVFVKVDPVSYQVAEGNEPLYKLNPGGGWEPVREAKPENSDLEALEDVV